MSGRLNLTPQEINSLYPISGVRLYSRVLVLRRYSSREWKGKGSRPKRGQVLRLSQRSRTNFVLTVMRSGLKFNSLLILSYGADYPKSGVVVKKHLNRFLGTLKRRYVGVKYFWFIEFQRRGAPHFNIGLTISGPKQPERDFVASEWAKIVGGDDYEKVYQVNRFPAQWQDFLKEDAALRYIVAYATKPHQKTVPSDFQDVGRFWGMSRVETPETSLVLSGTEGDVRALCEHFGRDVSRWVLLPRVIFV